MMRTNQSEFRVLLHSLIPAVANYEQGRLADERKAAERCAKLQMKKQPRTTKKEYETKEAQFTRVVLEALEDGPMTSREIGVAMGVSRSTAFGRLVDMEKFGLVRRFGSLKKTRWVKA